MIRNRNIVRVSSGNCVDPRDGTPTMDSKFLRNSTRMNDTGIYFLADDGAYDWTIGLLESIRLVLPDVRLYCIPFSDRVEELHKLSSRYQFEIVSHDSLTELDAIGWELLAQHLHPGERRKTGAFRKFFCFWGPLQRFLYLDADIVVLDGFEDFYERSIEGEFGLRFAHPDPEWVYRPGDFREEMIRDFGSRSFNTGLWSARSGLFSIDEVQSLGLAAKPHVGSFVTHCIEQPFINYSLDISRKSLQRLSEIGIDECAWAGETCELKVQYRTGGRTSVFWPDGRPVPAIHWAGFQLHRRSPRYSIFRHFRTRSMTRTEYIRWLAGEVRQTRMAEIAERCVKKMGRVLRG